MCNKEGLVVLGMSPVVFCALCRTRPTVRTLRKGAQSRLMLCEMCIRREKGKRRELRERRVTDGKTSVIDVTSWQQQPRSRRELRRTVASGTDGPQKKARHAPRAFVKSSERRKKKAARKVVEAERRVQSIAASRRFHVLRKEREAATLAITTYYRSLDEEVGDPYADAWRGAYLRGLLRPKVIVKTWDLALVERGAWKMMGLELYQRAAQLVDGQFVSWGNPRYGPYRVKPGERARLIKEREESSKKRAIEVWNYWRKRELPGLMAMLTDGQIDIPTGLDFVTLRKVPIEDVIAEARRR